MLGFKGTALVDSGATHNFVSRRWVLQHGLEGKLTPIPSLTVNFAGSSQRVVHDQLRSVKLQLVNTNTGQVARYCVSFVVVPMEPDIILGFDWLRQVNPVVDWQASTLTVPISLGRKTTVVIPASKAGAAARSHPSPPVRAHRCDCLLSHLQAKRLLRKPSTAAWLAWVRAGSPGEVSHGDIAATGSDSDAQLPPKIAALLHEYADVFQEPTGVPPDRGVSHKIDLVSDKPVFRRPYKMSAAQLQELKKQLTELLDKGWIRPSNSPYGAPVLFVQKKDGSLRCVADYRWLNSATIKSRYPLPNIQDLFDQVRGAKVFSKLDLASGYHQVPVNPADIPKTAIVTRYGQFEYTVMPFGLCNAPATFSRMMNQVLGPFLDDFVVVYLDDVLIFSKSLDEHVQHVRTVLDVLRANKLFAKRRKCAFALDSISYLGHIITGDGVKTDPAKIAAVQDWPIPTTVHDVRAFLGLCSYYRRFVPKFAHVAAPLTDLTADGVHDVQAAWGAPQQQAFERLKALLISAPILVHADPTKPFVLRTDASDFALGAVLMQEHEGCLHPVAYHSRKFTPAESRYGAYAREMSAVIDSLKHFEYYCDGQHTTVESDQEALSWFWQQSHLDKQQARWMAALQAYDLQLRYVAGRFNMVADALSRRPDHQVALGSISVASTSLLQEVLQAATSDRPYQKQLQLAKQGKLPGLEATDGVLYQVNKRRRRIVIPSSAQNLKRLILHEMHATPTAGHLGYRKTMRRIVDYFWWPHLATDVQQYTGCCLVCLGCKSSTQVPIGLLHPLPVPTQKWQQVSMDFVTALPRSKGKHDAIMVVTDRLTKMVVLIPTNKQLDAPGTAELFRQHVVSRFGLPSVIVSDRDSRFLSKFWRALFVSLGTKLSYSSAFHPQTDGQTERVNRSMEQVLRTFCLDKPQAWAEQLCMAEFVLNAAPHVSIGFSPFKLMYGYEPVVPATLGVSGAAATVPAAEEFLQRMAHDLRVAQESMQKAQEQQRRQANKHRRDHVFTVGDMVMLSTTNLNIFKASGKKVLEKFIGPFAVEAVINPVAVKLSLPPQYSRLHPVFHVSLLRPVPTDVAGWHVGLSEPELLIPALAPGASDQRRVEEVFGHDTTSIKGENFYVFWVKWAGLPSWDASWELEPELLQLDPTCAPLLQQYKQVYCPTWGVDTHLLQYMPPDDVDLEPDSEGSELEEVV
jgi:transposase InsO family protein